MPPKNFVRFVAFAHIPAHYHNGAALANQEAENIAKSGEGTEVTVWQVTFREKRTVKASQALDIEDVE